MGEAFSSFFLFVFLFCGSLLLSIGDGASVEYDHRALMIDGKRRVLISGSIHYPRSTPEMWPDLVQKSKDGGLDVIDTYVFWNLHEPVQNQYDFQGRNDLVKFAKTVGAAGLYVHLRIGPYVCAEWNYGGFPVWLHFIPGIQFRTDNEPFKREMQRFTAKIVDMMKQEKLFASQGGPIILAQIENEYGNVQSAYGSAAKSYINWAAKMATSLDTGVPWVMCRQADAPDPIINTCNGVYCDQFTPNSDKKPKIWTESYTGWFLSFGGRVPHRPVEDIAFAVARFYQKGGTFHNYYMYHGGTNFGRSAGGPFITTSYDYDAPIDEYGILRQPKWGHLKDLHKSIKLCEEALIATDPTYTSLGTNLEAHVYKTSEACAAFLANVDNNSNASVSFNGNTYHLPAWSVSILPDCKSVVFNTAKINSQATRIEERHLQLETSHQTFKEIADSSRMSQTDWSWVGEPVGISKSNAFKNSGLLEQINTTGDATDYLWYSISTKIQGDESFLLNGTQTLLQVESLGHALHAFINGKLAGSGMGDSSNAKFTLEKPIILIPGDNTIDLLSMTVGLKNSQPFFDIWGAGITGVKLIGKSDALDLSSNQWTYQIGLKGEELGLYRDSSGSSLPWISETLPKNQPLIWYKTRFDSPDGSDPIALDFTGMRKGEAWVNGQSIGRYWPAYISPQNGCEGSCNYRGTFYLRKCYTGCGSPSQKLYHVPRSWIHPRGNTLVLFEEMGGDPAQISFVKRQAEILCAHVSESHPPPLHSWGSDLEIRQKSGPLLHLECPSPNKLISKIKFASFGTPQGTCGNYGHGMCSSNKALAIVQQACVGSRSCNITVSTETFGDPCKELIKSLAVEVACTRKFDISV
ncbi:hypothetical protein MRB53_018465 [Persea americana]|uniref:Uncharacterized protein n=1 Tax=Persea americana TaxID=3435 RepID=A0ACC2M7I9_PERAE|nr:hypothetical protein MRB53_018465 [Persea americana]